MINEYFLNYMIEIGEDYREVNLVADSLDALTSSIDVLQDELLGKVRGNLTTDNIEHTVDALRGIDSLGSYGNDSFRNTLTRIISSYVGNPVEDDLSYNIFNDTFVEDISKLTPFLGEGFIFNIRGLYESLDVLYRSITEDLQYDIESFKVDKDSKLISYISYLSPRIAALGEIINDIVGVDDGLNIYDDADKAALFAMCDLMASGIIEANEPLYIYTGDLDDLCLEDASYYIGSVLGSGHIDMSDPFNSYPINQSVILTLMVNGIGHVDIFDGSEQYHDSEGNLRVKQDCVEKRLCVSRDGVFQLIK